MVGFGFAQQNICVIRSLRVGTFHEKNNSDTGWLIETTELWNVNCDLKVSWVLCGWPVPGTFLCLFLLGHMMSPRDFLLPPCLCGAALIRLCHSGEGRCREGCLAAIDSCPLQLGIARAKAALLEPKCCLGHLGQGFPGVPGHECRLGHHFIQVHLAEILGVFSL